MSVLDKLNYGVVYKRIDEFLHTRRGIVDAADYVGILDQVVGIFMAKAHTNDLKTKEVLGFFDLIQNHVIRDVYTGGQERLVSTLMTDSITSHPLYNLTEFGLMHYKPVKAQIGAGEVFFCFYSADSIFSIDQHSGYDIELNEKTIEVKKIGTNWTGSPKKLDGYAKSGLVDQLLAIKPVSNANKPQKRSSYACGKVTDWREFLTHSGKNKSKLQFLVS